jgi:hypothetical protein
MYVQSKTAKKDASSQIAWAVISDSHFSAIVQSCVGEKGGRIEQFQLP